MLLLIEVSLVDYHSAYGTPALASEHRDSITLFSYLFFKKALNHSEFKRRESGFFPAFATLPTGAVSS